MVMPYPYDQMGMIKQLVSLNDFTAVPTTASVAVESVVLPPVLERPITIPPSSGELLGHTEKKTLSLKNKIFG